MKKTKTNIPKEVARVINTATGEIKISKPKNVGKTIGGGSSNARPNNDE